MLFFGSVDSGHLCAQPTGFVQAAADSTAAKVPTNQIIALRTFGQDQDASDPALRGLQAAEIQYKWPLKSITEINIDIRDTNKVVPNNRVGEMEFTSWTDWTMFDPPEKVFAWAAPNIKYQPLYFEDVALERYGQTRGGAAQFASSSFHFFKSTTLIPYSMWIDHPYSCDYPLGFCRPGICVPATRQLHWFGCEPRR